MAYDFSNVNVLVVESTTEMFKLFKTVLNMLSVPERNIDSSYNYKDAYQKFCHKKHDLIITDWLQNPDRGILLTNMIRKDPKSPNKFVPIIMTAGSGHYNRVIKARDSGISEYLVKPFSADSLSVRISRVIEKPRSFVVSDIYVGPDRRVRDIPFDGEDRRKEKMQIERQ
ncbi:MAG: response regulator [Alphaproteobacteria bacterium]